MPASGMWDPGAAAGDAGAFPGALRVVSEVLTQFCFCRDWGRPSILVQDPSVPAGCWSAGGRRGLAEQRACA